MRILLAEDDLLLGDGIRAGLRLEGDTVEWVTDGVAAENALVTDEFDLLVLDIGLPRAAAWTSCATCVTRACSPRCCCSPRGTRWPTGSPGSTAVPTTT